MRFTIKAFLMAFAFVAVWLGALLSRSTIAIEIASLFSIVSIFVALPLAIYDHEKIRRAFWAGLFSVGFGTFLVFNVGAWMSDTSEAISFAISNLPRFKEMPDTTKIVPAVFIDSNLQPQLIPDATAVKRSAFQSDVRRALPFLISLIFGVCGGIVTKHLSESPVQAYGDGNGVTKES